MPPRGMVKRGDYALYICARGKTAGYPCRRCWEEARAVEGPRNVRRQRDGIILVT